MAEKDSKQDLDTTDVDGTSANVDDKGNVNDKDDAGKGKDADVKDTDAGSADTLPDDPAELKKLIKSLRAENGRRRFTNKEITEKLAEYERKEAEREAAAKAKKEEELKKKNEFEKLAELKAKELAELSSAHEEMKKELEEFRKRREKEKEKAEAERQTMLKELPEDIREKYQEAPADIVAERLAIYKSTNPKDSQHSAPNDGKDGAKKTDDKNLSQWERNRLKILQQH